MYFLFIVMIVQELLFYPSTSSSGSNFAIMEWDLDYTLGKSIQ